MVALLQWLANVRPKLGSVKVILALQILDRSYASLGSATAFRFSVEEEQDG